MNDATETAIFLRRYQSWRKGEIDVFYPDSHAGPNPVEISVAIDRAIVALEAQPPCGADGVWRPIETAPLDGRAVLVMSDNWPGTKSGRAETCNGHNTYVAEWWAESNEWMCYMSLPCEPVCPIAPTHWMPLPDVPSSQPAAPVAPQFARAVLDLNACWNTGLHDRVELAENIDLCRRFANDVLAEQVAHPDDVAVDRFASAMKAKMAASRAKGRGGWDDRAECSEDYLQAALSNHLAKGDPVDVGNFAMMLFSRGEKTAAPATVAVPDEWREILAELADDVKCNVAAEYPPETRHYPSQKRRFDEAMEIVLRAEAMLAASQREGGGT